jgi:hypothetical protein
MSKRDTRKSRNPVVGESGLGELLEIFFAFDRAVVESSMNLYNVHERNRIVIREHNRRLHDALRERPLPPFISIAYKHGRSKYRRFSA